MLMLRPAVIYNTVDTKTIVERGLAREGMSMVGRPVAVGWKSEDAPYHPLKNVSVYICRCGAMAKCPLSALKKWAQSHAQSQYWRFQQVEDFMPSGSLGQRESIVRDAKWNVPTSWGAIWAKRSRGLGRWFIASLFHVCIDLGLVLAFMFRAQSPLQSAKPAPGGNTRPGQPDRCHHLQTSIVSSYPKHGIRRSRRTYVAALWVLK